jgi:cytoskeleton protein RodZ
MANSISRKSSRPDSSYPDYTPSGRSGAPSMQPLGALLRERREAMGVTLAEVEVATRIRQKYLSALESEEWHLLPGEVVGRGFLRNYADYLGLDPSEVMERRRAVVEPNLSAALSTTSAGAPLPPERTVDYRPKEVDLKDETDGIQRGEISLTPIVAIVALAVLVGLGWWSLSRLSLPLEEMLAGVPTRITGLFARAEPAATTAVAGVINTENLTGAEQTATPDDSLPPPALTPGVVILGGAADAAASGDQAATAAAGQPPATQPPAIEPPTATAGGETAPALAALLPTNTPAPAVQEPAQPAATPTPQPPTPEPPTATLEPPTATPDAPTATPVPTDTPTPEPQPVAAASCADPRAVIVGPGMGQVLNGVTGISGTASHENFQYYKLEYAPGAAAAGGYVYFDGSNSQVNGGLLGNLDTRVLPNGDYTIRLTVVDQTGNFPAPCDVTVTTQN